jgi:hypothetical protein
MQTIVSLLSLITIMKNYHLEESHKNCILYVFNTGCYDNTVNLVSRYFAVLYCFCLSIGRAIAQAVSRWLPTLATRVHIQAGKWGLWWTKRHWGRFSLSTSVSRANHSTNFSIIIITRGWHNRPIDGRSAKWTQLDSTPHYANLILFYCLSILINADIFVPSHACRRTP